MKSVKKFTFKMDILVFICVTILFLFQAYGMIDSVNLGVNISSEFHKVFFAVFFLALSTYKVDSCKNLLHGILTIVCISLCLDFRGEYDLEIVLQYATIYLFALPLSEFLNDAKRHLYLKWYAVLYSCISFINLLGCYLLLLGIGGDILPTRFSFYKTRLSIGPHPNITAVLFSISIGMLVLLIFYVKEKAVRVFSLVLTCAYFPLLWLTNSRTNVLLMTLFVVGTMFFAYLNRLKKVSIKKIAIVLFPLCGLAILLFILHSAMFSHHRDELLEQMNTNVDLQMSFWNSLASFNGRTDIWKATLDIIFSNKNHFWFGTGMTVEAGGAWHAHNAWIQSFLNFGIFGLTFSIYYTIRAVKAAIVILFLKRGRSTMPQKVVALLVCVILVANTMEPYIFVNLSMLINFVFFFLLGYMLIWERDLKKKSEE